MKNVIVFGGSGFLGSYIVDELSSRNYSVKIADIKAPEFTLRENVEFVECDITDSAKIKKILSDTKIIYNFAGFSDVDESINFPLETINLNVLGNINILNNCKSRNIERFIFASSAYALSNKGSFYGISKYTSEKIIEEFSARFKIPFTIVRYGSLYGERANEANGIYKILKQALINGKIEFPGDGEGVREYIHASDAATLSVDIIESKKYINNHIILTGMERLRHKDILRMIQEIFNDKIAVSYTNKKIEGHYSVTPYSIQPNTAKKLVLNPYIDLGQGMLECAQHLQKQLKDTN